MKRHLFVIGDSISIQYGPYLKQMINHRFDYDRKRGEEQALLDLDKPVGANGGDSSMLLAYLQEEEQRGTSYDILMINCGLHDIKTDPQTGQRQVPLEQYRDNMQAIIEKANAMSRQFIWIRTTDADEHIHNRHPEMAFHRYHADIVSYNEAADALMRDAQVPILDLYAFTRTFGQTAFCDHVHYTDEVRRLQAAYLAGCLEKVV